LQEEARETGKTQFVPDLKKVHQAAITWLALMEENLNLRPAGAPAGAWSVESPSLERASAERGAPASPRKGQAKAGGSLLIVDDDQDNRDLLARRLQRLGYQVAVAANGLEGLELIQARKFDLVLLDLIMPGMDGLEALRQARQRHSMSELPVIVITGRDSSADVVEALRFGANDYVTKPVEFAVVQARTETHLRFKQTQEQLKSRMDEIRKLAGSLEKRNEFIRGIFGRYVTDAVVQNLLETPQGLKLGGEKREVTVLFSDLRGFTATAESLPPERVVEMLNIYLGEMTEIISGYEGVIDEFIGDAILAIFGAPLRQEDHAERAVACALAMQLSMGRVNERLAGLGIPALKMGIGINTGRVVVGNIGSAKRAKFGVVGAPVNVASRIQSAAGGGQILLAESTAARMQPILSVRDKQMLSVKGIVEQLAVYNIDGLAGGYNLRLPAANL
jgi:class 3 adenylate cyclase/CheY-like chemotaxis protein